MSTLNVSSIKNPSAGSAAITLDTSGNALVPSLVPPGTIQFYAADSAPAGYLKANGALISRTTYADLFTAIGTTFGVGDGSTTFAVPDLRGEFARGWDDARGVDSGRAFGSAQSGSRVYVPKDNGQSRTVNGAQPNEPSPYSSFYDETFTGGFLNDTAVGITKTYGSTATADTLGTVRPRNIALLAIIKF